MISLLGKVPREITVALSGGVDSMALISFLKRNHRVSAAFFNHGTETSKNAEVFVREYCDKNNIRVITGSINGRKPDGGSLEEWWRDERYNFLKSIPGVVATAHHLDDCVETWLWGCFNGEGRLPMASIFNVIRPLLLTPKSELISWCQRYNVPWQEDKSNEDCKFQRNFIRHKIIPLAMQVNPGLRKTIAKKIRERYQPNT